MGARIGDECKISKQAGGINMIKDRKFIVGYAFVTVVFVLFQLYKYDLVIIANAKSVGFAIILGLLDYFLLITYAILIIYSLVYAILKYEQKRTKALLPIAICVFVVLLFFVFPTTNLYLGWNYNIYKEDRIKTIEMIEKGTILDRLIDKGVYMVPFRHTSYTGTMIAQKRVGILKVLFFVYKGIADTKIIVYVSDDSGIAENDFNFLSSEYYHTYSDINKLSQNWYSATMKN